MEENFANDLIFFLRIDIRHKDYLDQIRHWNNIKIAIDSDFIWAKDFTKTQLGDIQLKSIPFTTIYYSKDNLLFPVGSLLPSKKIPNFLWTPISRALPIELPNLNHNFFELNQEINIKLIPNYDEKQATVLLVDKEVANKFIETTSTVRLQHLKWVVINDTQFLFFGTPILPLNGQSFWQKRNFILPLGLDIEFPILENYFEQKIDSESIHYIWWTDSLKYTLIPKNSIQPLSFSSWRKTIEI